MNANKEMKAMSTIACRILFLGVAVLGMHDSLFGQQTTLVKTIEQNFNVNSSAMLEINNKYGGIVVNGWDQNKVLVNIRIATFGKTSYDTEKLMDRVEFDFNVTRDYVIIETVLDRRKGVFADFFSTIGDYSKALLSKNSIDIDFEVFVPHGAAIDLKNRFGDIVLNDLSGKVTISLAHGNFKSGDLPGFSRIQVSYGNISVSQMSKGYVSLRGGELDLPKSDKVNIRSSSSKLFLKEASELSLESTSDKVMITRIGSLKGKGSFSNIEIQELAQYCDFDQSYGELFIHAVKGDFSVVKLTGKSADFTVNVLKDASFSADITTREDKLLLVEKPDNMERTYTDEKQRYVNVTGFYGKNSESKSVVKINALYSSVAFDYRYPEK